MPASMISAVTGSKLNVIGSSNAIVAVGPMPGRTPTSVPSMTPRKQKKRFSGANAVEMPRPRSATRFIGRLHRTPVAEDRQRQLECPDEDEDRRQGQAEGDQNRRQDTGPPSRETGDERGDERGRDDPEVADRRTEEDDRSGDHGRRLPRDGPDSGVLSGDGPPDDDQHAEKREQAAEREREVARAHSHRRADLVGRRAHGKRQAEPDEDDAGEKVLDRSLHLSAGRLAGPLGSVSHTGLFDDRR